MRKRRLLLPPAGYATDIHWLNDPENGGIEWVVVPPEPETPSPVSTLPALASPVLAKPDTLNNPLTNSE